MYLSLCLQRGVGPEIKPVFLVIQSRPILRRGRLIQKPLNGGNKLFQVFRLTIGPVTVADVAAHLFVTLLEGEVTGDIVPVLLQNPGSLRRTHGCQLGHHLVNEPFLAQSAFQNRHQILSQFEVPLGEGVVEGLDGRKLSQNIVYLCTTVRNIAGGFGSTLYDIQGAVQLCLNAFQPLRNGCDTFRSLRLNKTFCLNRLCKFLQRFLCSYQRGHLRNVIKYRPVVIHIKRQRLSLLGQHNIGLSVPLPQAILVHDVGIQACQVNDAQLTGFNAAGNML